MGRVYSEEDIGKENIMSNMKTLKEETLKILGKDSQAKIEHY